MNQLFTQRSSYLSRSRLSLLSPTRTAHLASPSRTLEAAYCVTVSARVVVIGSGLLLARPLFSDSDGTIKPAKLSVREAIEWPNGRRIMLKFNNKKQAIGDEAELLSGVLGLLGSDYGKFLICEESWHKITTKYKFYNECVKVYKVEKVELSEDRMVAGSTKGYRMVRPTRGVVEGAWYFEIRVLHLGETGHTQLGWSTEKSDFAGTGWLRWE
ncbi:hypothetical protein AHAS_Ahas19G0235400 [Arachis hypogaea]